MSDKQGTIEICLFELIVMIHNTMKALHIYSVKVQGKQCLCSRCPCAKDMVYARFEGMRTFL